MNWVSLRETTTTAAAVAPGVERQVGDRPPSHRRPPLRRRPFRHPFWNRFVARMAAPIVRVVSYSEQGARVIRFASDTADPVTVSHAQIKPLKQKEKQT